MQNLKILQIGECWLTERSGGLNRYFCDLLNYLQIYTDNLKGMILGNPNKLPCKDSRLEFFEMPQSSILSRFFNSRKTFVKITKKQNFDLIVSHFCLYTFPFIDLIKNKPFIVHFHGPFAYESEVESKNILSNKIKYFIEKSIYSKSKKFIVLSQAFKNLLIENYNIPEKYIEIIPGGVNTDKFMVAISKDKAREKFNIPEGKFVITCVRRLVKRMGLENLINAISIIKEKNPEIMLLIAGKGPIYNDLQEMIRKLNLQGNVKLLGFVPDEDLPFLYRSADFSIVPTTALEGFGLIVLESLASGTPVMVTPVGGLPEVIRDFSPELILNDCTVNSLVEGITSVLNCKIKLPDKESCIDFVKNNYDWSIITKRIYNLYKDYTENFYS